MSKPKQKPSRLLGFVTRFRVIFIIVAILFLVHILYSALLRPSPVRIAADLVKSKPTDVGGPLHAPAPPPSAATGPVVVVPPVASAAGKDAVTPDVPFLTPPTAGAHIPPVPLDQPERVKGVFVVLVRNKELHELRWSLRQLEDRFNHKYNYPYVFLNDRPFTDEFKNTISWITKANVSFGLIPQEHWSLPEWIDRYKMLEGMNDLVKKQIIYGANLSYRHMCRFNSGYFFHHPLLDGYDYYWRVEPDVQFTCDIDYDPFRYMQERDLKYGFTISLHEIPETVPTLWETTRKFMKKHPEYVEQHNTLDWVSADEGRSYNMCHFWSNFEIGKLDFFRSERYQKYFDYLDQEGGFFYERWGDAPVHSLAVAMFLRKEEVHWFQDIGYVHTVAHNCPSDKEMQKKCHCNPETSIDRSEYSCTRRWVNLPASP
ncbi:hypothetical protein IWQ60_000605 [Tieghemiomyces parasiticus]|uniref:Uncharacterized protein n=1 Tax=Tieghemiomyces parasiticus TaxID=78921 RepID=A0A9W8AEJ9_9FUNG|nr:hypothetical protein IWQ60_000605 [Tieghemiomyces parasiticus]